MQEKVFIDMVELKPHSTNQQSFYGKANVLYGDNMIKLKSYETTVAYITDGEAVVKGTYSLTTLKHIKEFLKQHGFKADTKKQIEKDYIPSNY